MDSEELVDFFTQTNKLKQTIRYSSCPKKIQESSAGHSWHVALMVPIVAQKLGIKINVQHATEIALVHDLAERVLKEDFDSYLIAIGTLKEVDKKKSEKEEMDRIKNNFSFGNKIYSLWSEYGENKTREAKFVRALDKLESHLHIIERGASGDNADDGKHQATYADNAVKDFPELAPLLKSIKKKLKLILEKQGLKWDKEYNYPEN
ncbi:MAG: HD domain-containing protein [archaeon]